MYNQQSRFCDHPTMFFRLLALFSVTRCLAIAALPWIFDLWSSRSTVFMETESSWWILSSAVNLAAAVLWFLDTIVFSVRQSLSLSFGFRRLFLLADDVSPWSVYAVITLETAALETSKNLAVSIRDASAKRAPTNRPLWKSDKSPILFLNTICNALTLAIHNVNKQKSNDRYFSLQPTQTLFSLYFLAFPLLCPFPLYLFFYRHLDLKPSATVYIPVISFLWPTWRWPCLVETCSWSWDSLGRAS